ncbi:MAG: RnfABCDGE type electron transport complex subunit B [Clostridia bacterium]|nr:RnfABCDGE type electron transport complex subunit B [Clostridia bacterium]
MDIMNVLIPVGIFAGLGILFGVALAIASRVFAVESDPRVEQVLECLPGANCGGCGYSGCAALAQAIVKGEATPNACNSCSAEGCRRIGEIMGIEVEISVPLHAHVMCSGNCHTAKYKYSYEGAQDCIAAEKHGGGNKACPNGCIGLGTCVAACKYDAIHIVNGLAVVDDAKCIGCGACANLCPKHLISMIPVSSKYCVECRSVENGAITRKQCDVGCISCKICEKNCPVGAVTVTDFVASIDQKKCIGCGKCAEKCPRKIIKKAD